MPRHSPCALISLTSSEEARAVPFPPSAKTALRSLLLPLSKHKRFAGLCFEWDAGSSLWLVLLLCYLWSNSYGSLNYAGFTNRFIFYEIVIVTHFYSKCSTIIGFRYFASLLPCFLLSSFVQFSRCSSRPKPDEDTVAETIASTGVPSKLNIVRFS